MSVAMCLLLYGAMVGVVAPRLLPYLTRGGRAPGAAVVVWLIAVGSVVASWAAAAAALIVHVARTWNRPDPLALSACLAQVRSAATGQGGLAMQIGLIASTVAVSGFVVVFASRVARIVLRARVVGARHAESAHIIGRRVAGVDGLVVDAPQKMAYCLGGRPGTVVITSAAVAALDPARLDAVLAHEKAHLTGRHHLLLGLTRALAAGLPRMRLFTEAHVQVAQLLEMCADDSAARRHGSGPLLGAILALTGPGPDRVPATALGASSVGVRARVTRLADPDTTAHRMGARLLLAAFAAAVVAAPLLLAWASVSGFTACGPFTA